LNIEQEFVLMSTIPAAVSIALLVLIAGLLAWLLKRSFGTSQSRADMETVIESVRRAAEAGQRLDGQLAELNKHSVADAARLRENVIERIDNVKLALTSDLGNERTRLVQSLAELREQLVASLNQHRSEQERRHGETTKAIHESLQQGFQGLTKQLGESLLRHSTELGQRVEALTRTTDERLREIGGQVDKRLADGFEKTTATFADVLKRLALIDEAQKKITALSGEVVGLQEVLADKRSRGAFGEVQLGSLVRNVMPEQSYAIQHRLPNDKIADCVLFLPEPTGTIAIDAKFPLESYRRMTDFDTTEHERKQAERQFKQDIKKHIKDIAEKYILPQVTSDGAVMFIPAEAVFAEIQAHHADLVEEAHRARVWMVSPTTLWAILNTACAVLKDAATREQVHIIQEHLVALAKDFGRFRKRIDDLANHVRQAHDDVQKVHISADKISDRFEKIERVELDPPVDGPTELQKTD
jgi:DNA recombination protein RmuC